MEIEKYSPKWLLEKINESKTDAHKLMHIIEYRKELVESIEKQLLIQRVSKFVLMFANDCNMLSTANKPKTLY